MKDCHFSSETVWRERNRGEFTNRHTQTMFRISVNNKSRVCNVLMFVLYIAFHTTLYLQFLGTFAALQVGSFSFVSSVCPHGTNRVPMDGFLWNLVLEDCSKMRRKNSNFIKILHKWRVLLMKTYVHLWYVSELFLEWEICIKTCREIRNTLFIFIKFFPPENRAFYDVSEQNTHCVYTATNVTRTRRNVML